MGIMRGYSMSESSRLPIDLMRRMMWVRRSEGSWPAAVMERLRFCWIMEKNERTIITFKGSGFEKAQDVHAELF